MKRCPECRRDYYDDSLLYCLDDGNALLEGPATSEPATAILAESKLLSESRTETLDAGELKSGETKLFEHQARNIKSIAVLPFANLAADTDNEYFCDGLAEELLNALSHIENLKVAARTSAFSFKGKNVGVSRIGNALGVDTILEGSVRKSGDRLRITVQLVKVSDGFHLWSDQFDRSLTDIFDIQEEISLAVVKALQINLLGTEKSDLLKRGTNDVEAYRFYLLGRYYWYKRTEESLRKGIEYFNLAIERDPSYAAAYDGLSDSYALLVFRGVISPKEGLLKAKAAAHKALEIDDTLAEAYASLAHIKLHDWDWSGLEEEFKRAIALNPGHTIAYHWYAEYLMVVGRPDEAIETVKQAKEIDPLSPVNWVGLATHLHFAHRYNEAIEQLQEGLELNPDHFMLHFALGRTYLQKGMYEQAIGEMQESVALSGGSTETLAGLGQAYAAAGMEAETQKVLDELNELTKDHYVSPYNIAKIYSLRGEKDQALAWLEKACDERQPDFIELNVEPVFDGLRAEARFQDLLRRVGLAE